VKKYEQREGIAFHKKLMRDEGEQSQGKRPTTRERE
jgi:hypothetical protein